VPRAHRVSCKFSTSPRRVKLVLLGVWLSVSNFSCKIMIGSTYLLEMHLDKEVTVNFGNHPDLDPDNHPDIGIFERIYAVVGCDNSANSTNFADNPRRCYSHEFLKGGEQTDFVDPAHDPDPGIFLTTRDTATFKNFWEPWHRFGLLSLLFSDLVY